MWHSALLILKGIEDCLSVLKFSQLSEDTGLSGDTSVTKKKNIAKHNQK